MRTRGVRVCMCTPTTRRSGVTSSPIVVNLDTVNNKFTFSGDPVSGTLFFQSVQLIGESGDPDELSTQAISPLDGTTRIKAVKLVRTRRRALACCV